MEKNPARLQIMDRTKILLVDDEQDLTESLTKFLERTGFECRTAENGVKAAQCVTIFQPDIIICDVMMPVMDGREFLRSLRQEHNLIPVIMLTCVNTSYEKVMTLEEGADDYISKPFEPLELVARIHAVMRRSQVYACSLRDAWVLSAHDLTINRQRHEIYINGNPAHVTQRAFNLLEYFITHPDEVIARERLLEIVWGWENIVDTRTVDIRIAELRRVLQDDPNCPTYIQTVPHHGYRFLPAVKVIS